MIAKIDNIFCNQITPPEFTAGQIEKCRHCRHASKKGNWCGHFGVWIQEKGKIITSNKRILRPSDKIRLPNRQQNRPQMTEADFQKYQNSPERFRQTYSVLLDQCKGIEIVDEKTYGERRLACWKCTEKADCGDVGCKHQKKLMDNNLKCPKGKW